MSDRNELILSNLDLVRPIAVRILETLPAGYDLEDLIQSGRVGLVLAAHNYDPARGPFCAWARLRIRGAILDSVRFEPAKYAALRSPAVIEMTPASKPNRAELETLVALHRAIAALLPAERLLIEQHYGSGRSLREIGRSGDLGVGHMQTRNRHLKVIQKLRAMLAGPVLPKAA